ncbi:MAG TPA: hypothetical protein VGF18_05950, partial [Candidatus Tumulicola sp.]
GDLAVAVYHDDSNYGMLTSVRIFGKGRRGGNYSIQNGFGGIYSLAYDNNGNLFADGTQCGESECYEPAYYQPALFELQSYSRSFEPIEVTGADLHNPSGLAWINPTLLLTDNLSSRPVGYKLLVSGSTAKVVATVPFATAQSVGGIMVRAGQIILPDRVGNEILTYDLKTGALESSFNVQQPFDAVLSQK